MATTPLCCPHCPDTDADADEDNDDDDDNDDDAASSHREGMFSGDSGTAA
jgi:hypothetical protein